MLFTTQSCAMKVQAVFRVFACRRCPV